MCPQSRCFFPSRLVGVLPCLLLVPWGQTDAKATTIRPGGWISGAPSQHAPARWSLCPLSPGPDPLATRPRPYPPARTCIVITISFFIIPFPWCAAYYACWGGTGA